MNPGPEIRPLQPPFPMQNFSFAPPNMGVGADKKSASCINILPVVLN